MTFQPTPSPTNIVPEGAPFSDEQRAWLSGFLAAALGSLTPVDAAGFLPQGIIATPETPAGPPLASNDDAPWHDAAMPADERMKLAEGRPTSQKLMAAMAQQDCGQCGYSCAAYANAIFLKDEARLNLCAPGGKETFRLVKALAAELGDASADAKASPGLEDKPAVAVPASKPGTSREQPVDAVFLGRRRLNGAGSEKDTHHVEFDIGASELDYVVGDSFGVFPRNSLGHVDQIIAMLGVAHTTEVRGRTLRDVLSDEVSLGLAPDALYELYSHILGGTLREKARELARGGDPDGDAAQLDVFAVVQKFAAARPHPEAFVDALEPLQPRLYSISSSPKTEAGRITLTVDAVRYQIGQRKRLGVASTFLVERMEAGETLRCYVQKAHDFALPADPNTPVIMIGPGTGIAPFRAFLKEREAIAAPGRNWLFYGHQRQATDFFYKDELQAMRTSGLLTRLSLAWSRDGAEKFYVQDRMIEVGAELWRWIGEGAHLYVCGDAKRMAKDVEAALVSIAASHGGLGPDEAVAAIRSLKKSGRFQADVY
ncbi:sulfite reductase subunit alpha [Kaistia terrae]|uniref:Sulfite reductase subunit alpha n=1 Tax=Kaistia terrae TaxID=537017 RepID=A0ABW0PY18_9HYPH|nr:sulfite reductase subunit alpha [Kaistia terrae]MCX5578518.1 sulfite reductase subunit alpha [Kaistia terrae]